MDDRGMPEASKRNAHVSHSLCSVLDLYPRLSKFAFALMLSQRYGLDDIS